MTNLPTTAEANIRNARLRTTQYEAVQKMLGDLLTVTRDGKITGGVLIVGETGSGKSTAVDRFVAQHAPVDEPTRKYAPVIRAKVSAAPTLNDLCESILKGYGLKMDRRHSLAELRQFVHQNIIGCGTMLIVIDEAQHLVDRGAKKTHEKMADFIKTLMSDDISINGKYPGVSIALVGLPRTQELLQVNKQLFRRINRGHLQMQGFHVTDKLAKMDFFNVMVGLMQKSDADIDIEAYKKLLGTGDMLETLYYATDGRFCYMSDVSAYALTFALEANAKHITRENLRSAFLKATGFIPKPEDDPFDKLFVRRRLAGLGEPFGEAA